VHRPSPPKADFRPRAPSREGQPQDTRRLDHARRSEWTTWERRAPARGLLVAAAHPSRTPIKCPPARLPAPCHHFTRMPCSAPSPTLRCKSFPSMLKCFQTPVRPRRPHLNILAPCPYSVTRMSQRVKAPQGNRPCIDAIRSCVLAQECVVQTKHRALELCHCLDLKERLHCMN
jgi:hypothetical protein